MKSAYGYLVYRAGRETLHFLRHSPDYHYSDRVHYGHWGDLFMHVGKSFQTEEGGAAHVFDSREEAQAHIKPLSHSSWKVMRVSRSKHEEEVRKYWKATR